LDVAVDRCRVRDDVAVGVVVGLDSSSHDKRVALRISGGLSRLLRRCRCGHRAHAGGGASRVVVVVILRITLAVVLGIGEGSEACKKPEVLLELHVDFCCLLT